MTRKPKVTQADLNSPDPDVRAMAQAIASGRYVAGVDNKIVSHPPIICPRGADPIDTQYVYKGWKARFTCPTCRRTAWFHLNFLGQRKVVCDGAKFTKLTADEVKAAAL